MRKFIVQMVPEDHKVPQNHIYSKHLNTKLEKTWTCKGNGISWASLLIDQFQYLILETVSTCIFLWNLLDFQFWKNPNGQSHKLTTDGYSCVKSGIKHNRFFRVMFCYVLCQKNFSSVMLCSVMWKSKFFVLCYVMCYDFDSCPWTWHIHGQHMEIRF